VVAVVAVGDIQKAEVLERPVALVVNEESPAGCWVHSCCFSGVAVAGCLVRSTRCCVLAGCTFAEEAVSAVLAVADDELAANGRDL
jgi:hypothetical protein